jgi:hypothetical protein
VKTNGKIVPLRRPADGSVPSEPDLAKLARLIAAYAPHDGSFELLIPGVHANRFSRTNKECVHALRLPSLCIAARGAKTVIVGHEVFEYDASRMIGARCTIKRCCACRRRDVSCCRQLWTRVPPVSAWAT